MWDVVQWNLTPNLELNAVMIPETLVLGSIVDAVSRIPFVLWVNTIFKRFCGLDLYIYKVSFLKDAHFVWIVALSELVSYRRKRFAEGSGPTLCFAALCDVCSAEVVSVCAVAMFFLMPMCWFGFKEF